MRRSCSTSGVESLQRWPRFAAGARRRRGPHAGTAPGGHGRRRHRRGRPRRARIARRFLGRARPRGRPAHRPRAAQARTGARPRRAGRAVRARRPGRRQPGVPRRAAGGLRPGGRAIVPRPVTRSATRAGPARGRLVGDPDVAADAVLLCAGAHSGLLHPALARLVRPVKGEIVRLAHRGTALPPPTRTVRALVDGRPLYAVPRDDGGSSSAPRSTRPGSTPTSPSRACATCCATPSGCCLRSPSTRWSRPRPGSGRAARTTGR